MIDGRYRVVGELGRGSMGRVVLVSDSYAGDVPYACKVLERKELHHDFAAEYSLLRRLAHPAFVAAHRLGVDYKTRQPFALLELCEGNNLSELPAQGVDDVATAAASLLRGLDHLHRHGYVHGDLAPTNVVRIEADSGWAYKILDLGAGGRRGSRRGTTSGVLAFAAPERLRGDSLDPLGDLWSLGALLFQLQHTRHPFPGYPARDGAPAAVNRSGLQATKLDGFIDRLLATDPRDRFPTAGAALAELADITGRSLPLVRIAELAARQDALPYHDGSGQLSRVEHDVRAALESTRSLAVDVQAMPGGGRTRLLSELADRIAGREVPVIFERGISGDPIGGVLLRILRRLDPDAEQLDLSPEGLMKAVGRSLRDQTAPVCLVVDDLDRTDTATRSAVSTLARNVNALSRRRANVILVTGGAGANNVSLPPWHSDDVEQFLELVFPKRRVGSRVADPLCDVARGNPSLVMHILGELARAGGIVVDSAAVLIAAPNALKQSASSLEGAAKERLESLPEGAREAAGVLAYARAPVPYACWPDFAATLCAARVATAIPADGGPMLALASEATVREARSLTDEVTAHKELARRLSVCAPTPDTRVASAWHRLKAGEAGAIGEAEALFDALPPSTLEPLALALHERDDWPTSARLAMLAATVFERTGLVEEGIVILRHAAALANDDDVAARALASVGRLEARQSRHATAGEALAEALERGGEDLAPVVKSEILAARARAAVLSGALEIAQASCTEALALGVSPTMKGAVLYTLGLVNYYRGDQDAARDSFMQALELSVDAGDVVEAAAAVTGLGLVAHRAGDLDQAQVHYEDALQRGEEAGDDARVLTCLQNLGVVHHERGAWTHALDTYREAFALAEALGHTGRVVQLSGNLGNLWRYLGELDEARAVLLQGLTSARSEQNRHMEAILLNLLADVASDVDDWQEAEQLLYDSQAASRDAQYARGETEANVSLARVMIDRRDFERARRHAQDARDGAAKLESDELSALAVMHLASIQRQSVRGDRAAARRLSTEALTLVEGVASPDARWPVLLEAMMLARDDGALAEARKHAREVRRILQQLEDGVPAEHRDAFRRRRQRQHAWHETAALVADAAPETSAVGIAADQWTRLLDVNKRLSSEHNVDRLLEYIMDSAILLTGAERGFLLIETRSEEATALEVRVARNLDQENIRKKHLKISHGIARRVMDAGEAVITIDAMEDDRYRDQLSVHDLRLRSILCLPMIFRGHVHGAIYLDNRFRTSAFSETDLPYMGAFADLAAIALENARLMTESTTQREQIEAARVELEVLNAKLKAKLDATTVALEDTHRVVVRQQRQLEANHQYDTIIGNSPSIRRIFAMMDRLLDNDVAVLIEGESGTGKELVARAIHFNGARKDRPFVAVNCGAIPATLLESELFGHVRGAFTGANRDKMGLFEAAHTGTLMLDELGELPLEMQVKLLRVLQSGELKKVGATRDTKVDVRIIAATNRRLEEEVAAGRFREDLYYRLSVVPMQLPSLRERRSDIPLLVQHFIDKNKASGLGAVTAISPAALALLQGYAWPGNVRQLEMVLKNASVFAGDEVLQPHDFESFPDIRGDRPKTVESDALRGKTFAEIEREAIILALRDNRGNKKRSAEQLGIDRRTLYNKLAAYKIVVEKELTVA